MGIHEVLIFNDAMRDLVTTTPSLTRMRSCARDQKMTTLRFDGLTKVKEGMTTVEEVFSASQEV